MKRCQSTRLERRCVQRSTGMRRYVRNYTYRTGSEYRNSSGRATFPWPRLSETGRESRRDAEMGAGLKVGAGRTIRALPPWRAVGSAPAKLAKCGIAAHRATGPATVEAGHTGSDSWHGVE